MKLDVILDDVQNSEMDLAEQLRQLGEHHALDADLYHLGHSQAHQCAQRVLRLRPYLERYGARQHSVSEQDSPRVVESLRRHAAGLLGKAKPSGMLALQEMCDVYLVAQRNEMNWQILLQCLEAARDRELLEVATDCHERAEMVGRWLRTRIKVASAQVYVPS